MSAWAARAVRHYLLALQFFTRIPVTGALAQWVGYSPAMLRASAAHLPGIGALVGTVVAAVSWALLQALPATPQAPLVVALLGTVLGVLLTGGFHEDGLADVADGLGGSYDRARALEIMKDSRVGAFGAMALVLGLGTKVALLALLGGVGAGTLALAILGGHVVSRLAPLLTIRILVHVGDAAGSKSKPLADQITGAAVATGVLWCLVVLAAVTAGMATAFHRPWDAVLAALAGPLVAGLALASLGWAWMVRLLQRRLQGFTGDGLGATQQVCELAFYLGLAMAL